MPTKVIREPHHVDYLASMLRGRKLPITVSWAQGAARSSAQNRLAQRWFTDVALQLGDQTHEDVRAECKLKFGVPILRAENEAFRLSYDRTMRALPYEDKVEAIKAFDLPVTRLMTVKQMTAFMDAMHREYSGQGVRLTDPEALKYEEEFGEVPA
jgi:C-terminal processing protease CtpA/Prc